MGMDRKGIAVCGSLIVDKINEIAGYPSIGELTKIIRSSRAVGGCVCNVGIDLKKISPALDVSAIGMIGNDADGEYIKEILSGNGLDISNLSVTDADETSYTDVMSVTGGQRTFFTYAGADGAFTANDFDTDKINAKILHLGYFLLLDKIDAGEGLEILKKASAAGIETSIDLVSENSDRYSLVIPCLEHTDYLIINELEAGKLAEIPPEKENIAKIAQKLKAMGVRKKVIIHFREGAVCCSDSGVSASGSVDIPRSEIKGTTGCGDAFCAGALYGIYKGLSDLEILDFAASSAAMALRSADATSGLCTEAEIREYCKDIERMKI